MYYKVFYQRFFGLLQPSEMMGAYLNFSHRFVKTVVAGSLEAVYRQMQAEIWSPQGEARPLIASLKLGHTSLSVGDLVQGPDKSRWVCDRSGWLPLNDGPPEPNQPTRLWLATEADLQGESPQITRLKISDERDCLPPDAYTVETFGWTAFDDLVTLAKKLEQYPGFGPGVQVCIDLGESFYETEVSQWPD